MSTETKIEWCDARPCYTPRVAELATPRLTSASVHASGESPDRPGVPSSSGPGPEFCMPYGINRSTGLAGPSPQPPRDGDKEQARQRINVEVRTGRRPHPNRLRCTDCGHAWSPGERRHEYDHAKGYAARHHGYVEPVCTLCHRRRCDERGELIQVRSLSGTYSRKSVGGAR